MKKLVFALVTAIFISGAAFAASGSNGEINVKAGLYPFGGFTLEDEVMPNVYMNQKVVLEVSFSFAAEYLYPLNDIFKVGVGLEYSLGMVPKNKTTSLGDWKYTALPIYATVQTNPFIEKEIFIKGNIGYVASPNVENAPDDALDGGLYWAVAAGYEFPIGLIVELSYSVQNAKTDYFTGIDSLYFTRCGINVGYKFKI